LHHRNLKNRLKKFLKKPIQIIQFNMELGNWAGVIAISTASHTVEVLIDGLGWHRRSEYMIEAVNGGNPKNCHIFIRTVT
jgi:hypothetical protein